MKTKHYLTIDERQTIEGIQKKFNTEFPFLKIEFFRERHRAGIGTERKNMYVDKSVRIFNIQLISKEGKISLDPGESVQQLEIDFDEQYGLYVQIFRKSGNIWLETSKTDNWTLEQQNEEGRSMQEELKSEKENPDDHDIW